VIIRSQRKVVYFEENPNLKRISSSARKHQNTRLEVLLPYAVAKTANISYNTAKKYL